MANTTYNDGVSNINQKYDSNKDKINQDYNTAIGNLQKDKSLAQQQQDTYNLIMQKYLPRQMRQAGLGGSGVAQSNIISMNNAQARTIADIENNYLSNKTTLETNRDDALRDNEDARSDALTEYNNDTFASAKTQAATFTDKAALFDFINQYKGIFNDAQIAELQAIGNSAVEAYTRSERDSDFALAQSAASNVDTAEEAMEFWERWEGIFNQNATPEEWAAIQAIIDSNIQAANDAAADEATNNQNQNFELAQYAVANVDTKEEKDAFMTAWRSKVSDEQWAVLEGIMNENIQATSDAAADEEEDNLKTTLNKNAEWASEYFGYLESPAEVEEFLEMIGEGGELEVAPNVYSHYEALAEKTIEEMEKKEAEDREGKYKGSEAFADFEDKYFRFMEDGSLSRSDYLQLEEYGKQIFKDSEFRAEFQNDLKNYENRVEDEDAAKDIPKNGRGREGDGTINIGVDMTITSLGGISAANGNKGDNFTIKYGANSALVERGPVAKQTTQNSINLAYGNKSPKAGETVVYNGCVYMYLPGTDDAYDNSEGKRDDLKWVMIRPTAWGREGFEAMCSMLGIGYYAQGADEDDFE